jgi:hypothetical protein
MLLALGGFCLAGKSARPICARSIARSKRLRSPLVAFKLHVAELHPTAVELSASLDRLSSRIHRLLERDGR